MTIGRGLVRNLGGLVAMRVLPGFLEAGFFPGRFQPALVHSQTDSTYTTGCAYPMCMYCTRHEFQLRLSIFSGASVLAGAFGGVSSLSPVNCGATLLHSQSFSPMLSQIYLAWVAILAFVDEITLLQDSYAFAVDCTGGFLLSKAP